MIFISIVILTGYLVSPSMSPTTIFHPPKNEISNKLLDFYFMLFRKTLLFVW